nr:MAG TPA: DNA-directed RNA polymerase subunit [Caudoviricetes sp.]
MTNEEASKELKEDRALYEGDIVEAGDGTPDGQLMLALDMAIKALEKQIPKKPTFEGDGFDENGNIIYDTWICPCCEEEYEVDYDDYKYCPWCGQMIDWRDFK